MVCVDYGDFLNITASYNRKHFDNVVVVTASHDKETVNICKKHDIQVVISNRMYENGAKFNKGKAINDGLKYLKKDDWVLITDADMVMAPNLRQIVESKRLNDQCIYGTTRYMCPDYKNWIKHLRDPSVHKEWVHQRSPKAIGVGFFQLVNGKCDKLLDQGSWYSEKYGHCGRSDRSFLRMWDDDHRGKIREAACIHLGNEQMSVNWYGRVTARFV